MMKKIFIPVLSVGLIVIDQLIKWWVLNHPSFVSKNENLIFGLGQNFDLIVWIVIILSLSVLLLTIEKPEKHLLALALIFAGLFSNFGDRILHGAILDYLKFPIVFHFTFNLADIYLFLGIIIYAYQVFRNK